MNWYIWLVGCFSRRRQAMLLYKRGMVRAKKHDNQGAIEDYSATIDLCESPAELRAMALYNRALVYMAGGDNPKGFIDLQRLLAIKESIVNVKTMARQKILRMENRAREHEQEHPPAGSRRK